MNKITLDLGKLVERGKGVEVWVGELMDKWLPYVISMWLFHSPKTTKNCTPLSVMAQSVQLVQLQDFSVPSPRAAHPHPYFSSQYKLCHSIFVMT